MDTMTVTETKVYPVGALHAFGDTECTDPASCSRMHYWPGGIPAELADA